MNRKARRGSKTAEGGFANEKNICNKFNNWIEDPDAQKWLEKMGFGVSKINSLTAVRIPFKIKKDDLNQYHVKEVDQNETLKYKKADVQIQIIIRIGNILKIENISLKKANTGFPYNQVDKRTIEDYKRMWGFDDEIAFWLKLFTGEISPAEYPKDIEIANIEDKRRLKIYEMPKQIQEKIINFFEKNKILIINDIIKGRGGLSAQWLLVTEFNKQTKQTRWTLQEINRVMNFYGNGPVAVSPKGSLYIGKITMQKKGGTPDPTKIQFKLNPLKLFELEK